MLSRLLSAGLALALLAGCGFQPLYGPRDGGSATDKLAAIKILRIPDRAGQQVRNFLLDRLNPRGPAAKDLYSLAVTLTEGRQDLAIRKDETATRANLTVSAQYNLIEIATGKEIFRASSSVTTSFNIVRSDFATVSAENDARRRAAREISDDIRTRLALFFNRNRSG